METKSNYTIIGLFVVILSGALIFIGFWLSAGLQTKKYHTYLVYMDESVAGLSEQAPVKFNGVDVGYVATIENNPHNLQQVIITLMIEQGVPVTETTVATLKSQGVTGVTFVGLAAHSASAPLLTIKPGQKYPVIPSSPSLLVQVGDAVRDATDNLNSITEKFQEVFNHRNTETFEDTLGNIDTFTKTLASNSKNIDVGIKSMRTLLTNTSEASNSLPSISKKLEESLSSIDRTTHQLSAASFELAKTMKEARTMIRNVQQQAFPSSIVVLDRVQDMAGSIDELSTELKRNPSMILRGKHSSRLGPGEK